MILNPWILGLLTGQTALLFVFTLAVISAVRIVKNWDFNSSNELQYELEKKTYLISTVMTFTLVIQMLMLTLLVLTADELSKVLPGAMCATGTLAANEFGFPLLWIDIVCFFLFFGWLMINHLDNQLETYPLTKTKYSLLIALYPFIIAKSALLYLFSANLNPTTITSCCGSIYSPSASGMGSVMAGVTPQFSLTLFIGLLLVTTGLYFKDRRSVFTSSLIKGLFDILVWIVFFIVSVLAIVSFISIYIYELPTHRCPFCFLKAEYYHIGVPIYAALFVATATGISKGTLLCFTEAASIGQQLQRLSKRLGNISMAGVMIFVIFGFSPFIIYYLKTGTLI